MVVDVGATPEPAADDEPAPAAAEPVNSSHSGGNGSNGSAVARIESMDTMSVAARPAFDPEASGEFCEVVIDDPAEFTIGTAPSGPDEVHDMADTPVAQPKFVAQDPVEPEVVQQPLAYQSAPAENPPAAEDEHGTPGEGNGFQNIDPQERLGWSLARLQRVLNVPRRNRGTTESWHRARITPELTISARNLTDNDAHLLDAVARTLKKMLWEAWEE